MTISTFAPEPSPAWGFPGMTTATYLRTFFAEKNLPFAQWEIDDAYGPNIITNEVVIEHIFAARSDEQERIAAVIRKIDFLNGDVNHFLRHLAQAIAI